MTPLAKPIDGLTQCHLRDLNKIVNELFKANVSDWWLSYMLRNSPQTNVVGHFQWWLNIGLDYGLVPSGYKPLHELMLHQTYVTIWRN